MHSLLMNDIDIVTPMKPRIEALNVDQPFVGEKFRRHRIGFLLSSVNRGCIILFEVAQAYNI